MAGLDRKLAARVEAHMLAALGVQTNTTATPQEPLTLDTLRKMMDKMPPRQTWLSSAAFPRENAVRLHTSREDWTVAHPDFWGQLLLRAAKLPADQRLEFLGPYGLEITNIDHEDGDDEHTKARKDRARKRYLEALAWRIT